MISRLSITIGLTLVHAFSIFAEESPSLVSPRTGESVADLSIERLMDHGPPTSATIWLPEIERVAMVRNARVLRAAAAAEKVKEKWQLLGVEVDAFTGDVRSRTDQQPNIDNETNEAMARQEMLIAKEGIDVEVIRLRNDLRVAYVDLLVIQSQLRVASEIVAANEQAKAPQERAAEVESAREQLRDSQDRRTATWHRLCELAGLPDSPPKLVAGKINAVPQTINSYQVVQAIVEGSPEMGVAAAELRLALLQYKIARKKRDRNGASSDDEQISSDNDPLRLEVSGVVAAEEKIQQTDQRLRSRFEDVANQYANAQNEMRRFATVQEALASTRAKSAASEDTLDSLSHRLVQLKNQWAYLESVRRFTEATVLLNGFLLCRTSESDTPWPINP